MKSHKNKNHGRRATLHGEFKAKHRRKVSGRKKKVHLKHR